VNDFYHAILNFFNDVLFDHKSAAIAITLGQRNGVFTIEQKRTPPANLVAAGVRA
jgi:hypothetical protein